MIDLKWIILVVGLMFIIYKKRKQIYSSKVLPYVIGVGVIFVLIITPFLIVAQKEYYIMTYDRHVFRGNVTYTYTVPREGISTVDKWASEEFLQFSKERGGKCYKLYLVYEKYFVNHSRWDILFILKNIGKFPSDEEMDGLEYGCEQEREEYTQKKVR